LQQNGDAITSGDTYRKRIVIQQQKIEWESNKGVAQKTQTCSAEMWDIKATQYVLLWFQHICNI
jgi:hypothetical protein